MGRVCPDAGNDGMSTIVLPDAVVPGMIPEVLEEMKAKLVS